MAVVSGGTTLIDNGALDAGVPTGALILLETQTASSSATIDFTSNIDSTYDAYMFKFINIHGSTDDKAFQFNMSTDGGSNYNVTKTTTTFEARHNEDDSVAALSYDSGQDLAQSTSFQNIYAFLGADADQSMSGELILYAPSSTTFVKHFMIRNSGIQGNDRMRDNHYAGYGNTTSAVDAIQFKFDIGNIDSGVIKLYGVK